MGAMVGMLVTEQIRDGRLDEKIAVLNEHYNILATNLAEHPYIHFPQRRECERFVGSSFQFSVCSAEPSSSEGVHSDAVMRRVYAQRERLSARLEARGIAHAWFGRKGWRGFTVTHQSWEYLDEYDKSATELPLTNVLLANLFDVPLYHTTRWEASDFVTIAAIIKDEVERCIQYGTIGGDADQCAGH